MHSEVFVDVQGRLESHAQKIKTQEVQVSNMYREHSERIQDLGMDLETLKKGVKKDIDDSRAELAAALKYGFIRASARSFIIKPG